MIMMMARKPFVMNSMMVMPMPSQNKMKPKSRFMLRRRLSLFEEWENLILFYADDVYMCLFSGIV